MSLGSFSNSANFFGDTNVQKVIQDTGNLNFIRERGISSESNTFCSWVFDLIKFDSIMTFFQEVALWFKSFNFPQKFKDAFHAFIDFCSLVWDFVFSITDLQLFYIWGILTTILFVIWLIQKRYDPDEEIEGPNTYKWEQRGKR